MRCPGLGPGRGTCQRGLSVVYKIGYRRPFAISELVIREHLLDCRDPVAVLNEDVLVFQVAGVVLPFDVRYPYRYASVLVMYPRDIPILPDMCISTEPFMQG